MEHKTGCDFRDRAGPQGSGAISVDYQQAAGTLMGHLVGNAPEHEAFHPRHAPVSNHNEISVNSLGDADESVSWVTVGIVHLGRYTMALGLGEQFRTDVVSVVAQAETGGLRCSGHVRESRRGGGVNRMNGVHLGPSHLCQGKGLSDGDSCAV
jgi:hypothetical protein